MQPTPLRVDKIARILEAGFSSTVIPLWSAARLSANPLARDPSISWLHIRQLSCDTPPNDQGSDCFANRVM
jgi:hypothetical protein